MHDRRLHEDELLELDQGKAVHRMGARKRGCPCNPKENEEGHDATEPILPTFRLQKQGHTEQNPMG
jgi:hypothetical protein